MCFLIGKATPNIDADRRKTSLWAMDNFGECVKPVCMCVCVCVRERERETTDRPSWARGMCVQRARGWAGDPETWILA